MSRERLKRRLKRNTSKRNREVQAIRVNVPITVSISSRWQWFPHLGVAKRVSMPNGQRR